MPLRSVEAASREDAVEAAREQFGQHVRIVGVRRVRSGGVLGFFATERYVAEVAPGQSVHPPAIGSTGGRVPAATASYDSPLASAAPARAGTAAPPRNGAAAWAAEDMRSGRAASSRGTAGRGRPAPGSPPAAARRTIDDDRLDDLAGLLDTPPAPWGSASRATPVPPAAPAGSGRSLRPRATSAPAARTPAVTAPRDAAPVPADLPAGPSPFTAALARMVSSDGDVRQAVSQALEPAEPPAPRPSLAAALRAAETAARSAAVVRQEASAAPSSTRQEEVAEVLRSALAQGHSDAALAVILRRTLAGDSPSEALSEAAAVEGLAAEPPVVPAPVVPAPVSEAPVSEAPGSEAPVSEAPAAETPEPEAPAAETPGPEAPAAEAPGPEAPVAEEPRAVVTAEVVEASAAGEVVVESEIAPLLARTASDPAPRAMPLDATTLMAPVSLSSPLSGSRRRGLPPVPPSASRPVVPPSQPTATGGPADVVAPPAPAPPAPAPRALATVTRLPVARRAAGDDLPGASGPDDADAPTAVVAPPFLHVVAASSGSEEIVSRLADLGVPRELLGGEVAARIEADGIYAALTRALAAGLPAAPELPSGAGDVVLVVGPGVETLLAARALAASLRLDPDRVQWATRGDLAGLAPEDSRITTTSAATVRRTEIAAAGTVTIVAVDAPLRGDVPWVTRMLEIWSPAAVWAVVEATRKPDDLELWLDGLARVDALIVQDTDLSVDPAAVLRLPVPAALLDGLRATPHRWASLLCERLDSPPA